MKLVASAVVRNEAGRYLDTWLQHVLTFCDEVRLLDDGSTDATREIAEAYHEVHVQPNQGPPFMEDESMARNQLLRWTMRGAPSYVLSIDADEFIGDTVAVRESAVQGHPVYALTMREVWRVDDLAVGLRVDGAWGDRFCPVLWQAPPMLHGSRWQIPRRKLACGREPLAVRRGPSRRTGIGIYHFGWTRTAEREARAERYFVHDGGRYHASKHLQSLLDPDDQVTLDWKPWPASVPAVLAGVR
jgi:glycosyltransferase involved in cell wall biosynthesis